MPGRSHLLGPFPSPLSRQEARRQPRLWGGTGAAFTFQRAEVALRTAEKWVGDHTFPVSPERKLSQPALLEEVHLAFRLRFEVSAVWWAFEGGCRPGEAGAMGCRCPG